MKSEKGEYVCTCGVCMCVFQQFWISSCTALQSYIFIFVFFFLIGWFVGVCTCVYMCTRWCLCAWKLYRTPDDICERSECMRGYYSFAFGFQILATYSLAYNQHTLTTHAHKHTRITYTHTHIRMRHFMYISFVAAPYFYFS